MNLTELTNKVKELNAEAQKHNMERQRAMGEKNAAVKEYNELVREYKEKWGVDITDKNIQSEYNKVFKGVAQKAAELEAEMNAIENDKLSDNDTLIIEDPEVDMESMIAEEYKKYEQPEVESSEDKVSVTQENIGVDNKEVAEAVIKEVEVEEHEEETIINESPSTNEEEEFLVGAFNESDDEDIIEPDSWGDSDIDLNSLFNEELGTAFK